MHGRYSDIDPDDLKHIGLLDWPTFLSGEPDPREHLSAQIVQRGLLYQLVAAPKTGKSLLALEIAINIATGKGGIFGAVLPEGDTEPGEGLDVLYVDFENDHRTIGDRFREMGVDPASLSKLHYASFPAFAPVDTEKGAEQVLALVRHLNVKALFIDTFSRAHEGNENDSSTYLNVYRLFFSKLKALGVAVIRLDHTGKDAALGARGSSAKSGDVDVSWILTKGQTDSTLKLTREFDRTASHPEVLHIHRRQSPLRHEVVEGKLSLTFKRAADGVEIPDDPKVAALVAELDRLRIKRGSTLRVQRQEYKDKGGKVKASSDAWTAALKFRHERADRESEQ